MPTLTHQLFPRQEVYPVVGTSAGPFAIPFPFDDFDEVAVYVDGVETFDFTITQVSPYDTAGNEVTLVTAVTDASVTIRSNVQGVRSLGETFVIAELSKELDRLFAWVQQVSIFGLFTGTDDQTVDVKGRRIANVAAPVDDNDLVTKAYVDDAIARLAASIMPRATFDDLVEHVNKPRVLYPSDAAITVSLHEQVQAWVNFDGTTGAILSASPDVQSVIPSGTGVYTILLTQGLEASPCVVGTCVGGNVQLLGAPAPNSITIRTKTDAGAPFDSAYVSLAFMGVDPLVAAG